LDVVNSDVTSQPFWISVVVSFIVLNILLVLMAYMTWFERRILAVMQDRLGPNRTGPFGLLQPLADGVKLLGKEDIIPANADKRIFVVAPLITFVTAPLAALFIPFGDSITLFGQQINLYATDVSIGVLLVLAISGVGVYGIILGGYASANRYSLLGGLRSAAQVISYEIILGLSLIGVFLLAGSLSIVDILNQQRTELNYDILGLFTLSIPNWYIFSQPLAFVIFLIAAVAETNRPPFDLPEAETELIGGFHTEYSGFRWSFYFLGEFIAVIVISLLAATVFLGGIDGPIKDGIWWLLLKTSVFIFFFPWLRATLPRLRYDQLMGLAWKVLLPLALINVLVTGFIVLVRDGQVF
jgi:NADH-quinone oxidoreductase subunit H